MLRELAIRNFAIIGGLELGLGPGMTCLTGETGAGKSILVDALSFILGGKPGQGVGVSGKDTAVEAMFDVSGLPGLVSELDELGLSADGELIIRRVLSASGRGKAYVNGSMVNLATLQRLGEWLVDIHGQHDHQSLLRVERHIGLLDEYCGAAGERSVYSTLYARVSALGAEISEIRGREREQARRLDLLGFQVSEIEAAALEPGEDEALSAERTRLMHADRLRELSQSAIEMLREGEPCALSLMGEARKSVSDISSLSGEQADALRLVESALVSIDEACAQLRDFAATLDADPERLDEVETRLDLISGLRKKYGDTIEDIISYGLDARGEMERLGHSEVELAELEQELERVSRELRESGARLSGLRAEGAATFSGKVQRELSDMGMPKAVFTTALYPLDEPGPRGMEKAEFLFSANPGVSPLPLAKIASGGELSRVMLALKVVLSRNDTVPTLVFDEVDSGVGGLTAGAVGRKLREAAEGRQVLCITHLPQIASMAREHLQVSKSSGSGGTAVTLRRLDKDERVAELARMLGGEEGSRTASAHAEELVRQGETNG